MNMLTAYTSSATASTSSPLSGLISLLVIVAIIVLIVCFIKKRKNKKQLGLQDDKRQEQNRNSDSGNNSSIQQPVSDVSCDVCGKKMEGNYVPITNTKTKEHLYNLCTECNEKFKAATKGKLGYPMTADSAKEIIIDGIDSGEIRKRCNVCGTVFCYSIEDMLKNQELEKKAISAQLRSGLSTIATSQILGAQQQAEADRLKSQIRDFTHCPNCHSSSLKRLTLDEYKSEIAKKNEANTPAAAAPATSTADELKKYKELLDEGIITQEEFDAKKKQLLGL